MQFIYALIGFALIVSSGCAQKQAYTFKQIGGPCEDCQMMFDGIPESIASSGSLVIPSEPGEPLIIRGTIFKKDGKTPAPDVILYVYQTDNKGLYSTGKNQTHAVRHGHIRGWVRSNSNGEYEIKTIRPASYPDSRNPQHIHPIIYEPGKGYYWIDEYVFDDDPLLTKSERSRGDNRGGSGLIKLKRNANGWEGTRNIVLGLNIPDY